MPAWAYILVAVLAFLGGVGGSWLTSGRTLKAARETIKATSASAAAATELSAREEWFRRFRWGLDHALSDNPMLRVLGFRVLREALIHSKVAGDDEKRIYRAAAMTITQGVSSGSEQREQ